MVSKSWAKLGIAAMLSSVTLIALLAGCGSTTTVTNTTTKIQTNTVTSTVAGAGGATTVTATVAGTGTGTASTVTATTTKTVTTTASGGSSGGSVMSSLVVYGDIVSSTVGCIDISNAHRGEVIVPRATVIDPKTGAFMDGTAVTSVVVTLADTAIAPITLKYGSHGTAPYTDNFWAGSFTVPMTEPLGVMNYTIKATAADGRTGTWTAFNVATSLMNIVQYDPNFIAASLKISATGTFPALPAIGIWAGEKVTFTNGDVAPHTVLITGPGGVSANVTIPASGTTPVVGSNVYTFATAGTYTLHLDTATSTATLSVPVNAAPTS